MVVLALEEFDAENPVQEVLRVDEALKNLQQGMVVAEGLETASSGHRAAAVDVVEVAAAAADSLHEAFLADLAVEHLAAPAAEGADSANPAYWLMVAAAVVVAAVLAALLEYCPMACCWAGLGQAVLAIVQRQQVADWATG